MTDLESPEINDSEEKVARMAKNSQTIIQIAGAALFGALSIVLSTLAPILPRFPPVYGIAYFDPVSITWMLCFLIFGPKSGILCSVIGFIGLIPFDESLPVIGPMMKLFATLPLILIPIILLNLHKREEGVLKSQTLKKPKNFIISGIIAVLVREFVMLFLNIVVWLSFFGSEGLLTWLAVIAIINPIQSVFDLGIPYIVVYGTRLDKKFELW